MQSRLLKYFSFKSLYSTLERFPLSVFSSILAAVLFWKITTDVDASPLVFQWFAASFNGIILFTALALIEDGRKMRPLVLQVLALPVLYFFSFVNLGHNGVLGNIFPVKNALVFLASLSLLFTGPFVFRSSTRGLWQFILHVFIQATVALLLGLALGIGLSLALVSIENLFLIYSIGDEEMSAIWVTSMIFVANMVFLNGLPKDFIRLETEEVLAERSMKLMIHFFSFPMLGLYGVILLAYLAKIALAWDWPQGMVALPVLIFSLLGFLTYGVAFIFKDDKKNRAIIWFMRLFPWTVLMLMAVYSMAFWQRIVQYGITENRYFGVSLGILLSIWALYYGLVKKQVLKVFPLSIFAFALFIAFGPWGVHAVSERSQVYRLEALLVESGILVDGVVQAQNEDAVPNEVQREIFSIIDYLTRSYGYDSIEAWFPTVIVNDNTNTDTFMGAMGFETWYSNMWDDGMGNSYLSFFPQDQTSIEISGYDYLVEDLSVYMSESTRTVEINGEMLTLNIKFNEIGTAMVLKLGEQVIEIPLEALLAKVLAQPDQSKLPAKELVLEAANDSFKVKFLISKLSVVKNDGAYSYDDIYGNLLVDWLK